MGLFNTDRKETFRNPRNDALFSGTLGYILSVITDISLNGSVQQPTLWGKIKHATSLRRFDGVASAVVGLGFAWISYSAAKNSNEKLARKQLQTGRSESPLNDCESFEAGAHKAVKAAPHYAEKIQEERAEAQQETVTASR
jgi:hypothetical protein